jgi:hypothetical protein
LTGPITARDTALDMHALIKCVQGDREALHLSGWYLREENETTRNISVSLHGDSDAKF